MDVAESAGSLRIVFWAPARRVPGRLGQGSPNG
jgi:hypothetical protein